MRPVTLVVVDDSAETRASVKRLLELTEGFVVTGEAGDGRAALAKVKELRPDCVLLDVNMPVMDGIAAAEALSVECPETAIVMMSVQGEQEYLRKAMAAGARDYLVKPFSPDELAATVRKAVQSVQRRRPDAEPDVDTRTVLVAGPKGGVGRTTLAVNIALALSGGGQNVCLLDLNQQFSDVAMMLDIVPAQTLAQLAESQPLSRERVGAALEAHSSGLRVLAGPARPEEGEGITPEVVQGVLAALQGAFHWVVVDAPAALSDIVLPVVDHQPECLLVITPELAPVRNAGQLLRLFRELEYDTRRVRLVLNKVDDSPPVAVDVIERNLGLSVAARIPDDPDVMREATTKGVPVVLGDPKAPSARALQQLVARLCGREEPARRHLFGFVSRRETRWAMG